MNPLLYTIPLLAAAYLAASDAAEVVKATEDVAKQIDQAQTDPISRKVWDAKAAEWVSLNEFLRRLRSGETYRRVEQVAILADIAGLVAEEWFIRATLWQAKEKPYYARLEQALGKSLRRIGAAVVLCSVIAVSGAFTPDARATESDAGKFHNVYYVTIRLAFLIEKIIRLLSVYNKGKAWFLRMWSRATMTMSHRATLMMERRQALRFAMR